MRWVAAIALCMTLWGCGSDSDEKLQGYEVRQLSDAEREALRRSLSQTLADPESAQFKWMPLVVAQRNKRTSYCGLVDSKGSSGAPIGFRKFSASIQQGSSGLYDHGVIEHVEGSPPIFSGGSAQGDVSGGGSIVEICKAWGYVDFGLAR
jgi:hypothetical protein